MSDSNHNDTYTVVTAGGSKLKGHAKQSGASVIFDIEREAHYNITLSTGTANVDETVKVIKHTGYVYGSGATRYFANGSSGGVFRYYYWDTVSEVLVAYCSTSGKYEAFHLSGGSGGTSNFINQLNSTTTSLVGYVSNGSSFTVANSVADIAEVTNTEEVYPGTTIIRVPSDSVSEVTYGAASIHPYYIFQNAAANKWVAKTEGGYWTAWYRSAAFDLGTQTLTDDQAAFSGQHFCL